MKTPLLFALLLWPLPALGVEQMLEITPLLERPRLQFEAESQTSPADGAWRADTARPDLYAIGLTKTAGMLEQQALVVAQRGAAPPQRPQWGGPMRSAGPSGGVMQTISAGAFAGQRVRLSARLKSRDAVRLQMALSVSTRGSATLGYDMSDNAIHGTTDWQAYEIVMDVPANATSLSYGFFLSGGAHLFLPADGKGIAWGDSFKLEVVDKGVPVSRSWLAADNRPWRPDPGAGWTGPMSDSTAGIWDRNTESR